MEKTFTWYNELTITDSELRNAYNTWNGNITNAYEALMETFGSRYGDLPAEALVYINSRLCAFAQEEQANAWRDKLDDSKYFCYIVIEEYPETDGGFQPKFVCYSLKEAFAPKPFGFGVYGIPWDDNNIEALSDIRDLKYDARTEIYFYEGVENL